MKKPYIFIIFLICFSFIINAQGNEIMKGEFIKDGDNFAIKLPYKIGNHIKYVFVEWTTYAIDIIDIRADGIKLSFFHDPSVPNGLPFFRTQKTIKGKDTYFQYMVWKPVFYNKVLTWNDGRGLIFTEIAPYTSTTSTNSYKILRDMNILEIRYRILLPYPSLTLDDIYEKTYIGNFTKEYTIFVDLSTLWTLLPFDHAEESTYW